VAAAHEWARQRTPSRVEVRRDDGRVESVRTFESEPELEAIGEPAPLYEAHWGI
jgi:hypothetical protein